MSRAADAGSAGGEHQELVLALWALVRATATRSQDREVRAAARACCKCLEAARAGQSHFLLQLRDGTLHENGARIRLEVPHLAPTAGLVALLQQRCICAVRFVASVGVSDLLAFANCLVTICPDETMDLALLREGCTAVQVQQDAGSEHGDPTEDSLRRPVVSPSA